MTGAPDSPRARRVSVCGTGMDLFLAFEAPGREIYAVKLGILVGLEVYFCLSRGRAKGTGVILSSSGGGAGAGSIFRGSIVRGEIFSLCVSGPLRPGRPWCGRGVLAAFLRSRALCLCAGRRRLVQARAFPIVLWEPFSCRFCSARAVWIFLVSARVSGDTVAVSRLVCRVCAGQPGAELRLLIPSRAFHHLLLCRFCSARAVWIFLVSGDTVAVSRLVCRVCAGQPGAELWLLIPSCLVPSII